MFIRRKINQIRRRRASDRAIAAWRKANPDCGTIPFVIEMPQLLEYPLTPFRERLKTPITQDTTRIAEGR